MCVHGLWMIGEETKRSLKETSLRLDASATERKKRRRGESRVIKEGVGKDGGKPRENLREKREGGCERQEGEREGGWNRGDT